MGIWKNYDPLEEVVRARVDNAVSAWVTSLKERGMLNGELAEQDELVDAIVTALEDTKGGMLWDK